MDISDIFENLEWVFASAETCQELELESNRLANNEKLEAMALIIFPSKRGEDFALGEAGQNYSEAILQKGATKGGKSVKHAFIVQAEFDPAARNKRRPFKFIKSRTAQEMREHVNKLTLHPGNRGAAFWWIRRDEEW
jgi:hypothetical protein